MVIRTDNLPWPLNPRLRTILQEELARAELPENSGAVITFRDPDYCADTGGFHPVEVAVTPDGQLLYITDFAFAGRPPMAEIVKELDFDFGMKLFQHYSIDYPIAQGYELFYLWQSNFLAYHRMNAYSVTVQPM